MATTPVRDTSTSPSGCIRLMKALSLALEPVISKTEDSMVLSTRMAMVCRSTVIVGAPAGPKGMASDQHHAFFGDRLGLVLRPEQHLVVGGARRDHREAVLLLVDAAIDDDRPGRGDHLGDRRI